MHARMRKCHFFLNIPPLRDGASVVPAEPRCHAEVIRASSVLSPHIIAAVTVSSITPLQHPVNTPLPPSCSNQAPEV